MAGAGAGAGAAAGAAGAIVIFTHTDEAGKTFILMGKESKYVRDDDNFVKFTDPRTNVTFTDKTFRDFERFQAPADLGDLSAFEYARLEFSRRARYLSLQKKMGDIRYDTPIVKPTNSETQVYSVNFRHVLVPIEGRVRSRGIIKGKSDPGENSIDTAVREFGEEVAGNILKKEHLIPIVDKYGKIVTTWTGYHVYYSSTNIIRPDDSESVAKFLMKQIERRNTQYYGELYDLRFIPLEFIAMGYINGTNRFTLRRDINSQSEYAITQYLIWRSEGGAVKYEISAGAGAAGAAGAGTAGAGAAGVKRSRPEETSAASSAAYAVAPGGAGAGAGAGAAAAEAAEAAAAEAAAAAAAAEEEEALAKRQRTGQGGGRRPTRKHTLSKRHRPTRTHKLSKRRRLTRKRKTQKLRR